MIPSGFPDVDFEADYDKYPHIFCAALKMLLDQGAIEDEIRFFLTFGEVKEVDYNDLNKVQLAAESDGGDKTDWCLGLNDDEPEPQVYCIYAYSKHTGKRMNTFVSIKKWKAIIWTYSEGEDPCPYGGREFDISDAAGLYYPVHFFLWQLHSGLLELKTLAALQGYIGSTNLVSVLETKGTEVYSEYLKCGNSILEEGRILPRIGPIHEE
jgi:hypothetical protein